MAAVVSVWNFLALRKRSSKATIAAVLIFGTLVSTSATAAPTPTPTPKATSAVKIPKGSVAPSYGIVFNSTAKKVVDIWEDFQCPKCAVFESINKANIAQLVSSKTVRVNYHILSFIGVESQRAAMVAGCAADQGKFIQAHDLLYKIQPSKENSGTWTYSYLLKKMATIGLKSTAFKSCVNTERYSAWVATVQQSVVNTSVVATPTVVVNGIQINRATDYSDPVAFVKAITDPSKIVTATPSPSPTTFALTFSVSRTMGVEPTIGKPTGDAPKTLVLGDLVVGSGDLVKSGDTVAVQYVLMDWATGDVLESSWKGNPITFALSQVISAWQRGIPGMKVGGRRLLIAPPDWAYGANGSGKVGANANLIFVVDLLAIPSHVIASTTPSPTSSK